MAFTDLLNFVRIPPKKKTVYNIGHRAIDTLNSSQAVTDKVTATTIMFRFVAPTNTGGLPIESYAVEYKETTQQWQDARRRVWPSSKLFRVILKRLAMVAIYQKPIIILALIKKPTTRKFPLISN